MSLWPFCIWLRSFFHSQHFVIIKYHLESLQSFSIFVVISLTFYHSLQLKALSAAGVSVSSVQPSWLSLFHPDVPWASPTALLPPPENKDQTSLMSRPPAAASLWFSCWQGRVENCWSHHEASAAPRSPPQQQQQKPDHTSHAGGCRRRSGSDQTFKMCTEAEQITSSLLNSRSASSCLCSCSLVRDESDVC